MVVVGKDGAIDKLATLRATREAQASAAVPAVGDLREYHANRINESWRKSVDGIIETGQRLLDAKADIADGEWESFVVTWLDFGTRSAQQLMVVAQSPRLADRRNKLRLPASWGTLYELATLDEDGGKRVRPHLKEDLTRTQVRALAAGRTSNPRATRSVDQGGRVAVWIRHVSTPPLMSDAEIVAEVRGSVFAAEDAALARLQRQFLHKVILATAGEE